MSENNHKCIRCGYSTCHLVTFKRHLARKNICKNVLSNDDLYGEYVKYNITNKLDKNTKKPQKNTSLPQKNTSLPQKNTILECKFCGKTFSRIDSLSRHLKKCNEKERHENEKQDLLNLVNLLNKQLEEHRKEKEEYKKEKEEYKIELEKRNKQIDELIRKTGVNIETQNNNIQNNIQILAYNNTDVSHLTDSDYLKCLKHSNFCIPHLIRKIHFNPKKPENHNIYISNLKNNYTMVYDGNKWNIKDRDESIQNLIDDKEVIIEQKLEEWIENGNNYPDIMKKFTHYIDKKENDTVLNKIKSEIKLMLFNNRDIISKC
jgi:hypothetical protein